MERTNVKKEGLILVDKPRGLTSHDVVDFVRQRLGTKKVGHAGTLDPEATGLLILLVGRYTKMFSKFVNFDKEYKGVMKLGEITSTGDADGKIQESRSCDNIKAEQIKKVFFSFMGESDQVPPMVSAIRLKGQRLYELARRGIIVERPPRRIRIDKLEVIRIEMPLVEFYVKCSKGTYIRKLAEDIGEKLGCGAHMIDIVRTAIGPFNLGNAVALDQLTADHLQHYTF